MGGVKYHGMEEKRGYSAGPFRNNKRLKEARVIVVVILAETFSLSLSPFSFLFINKTIWGRFALNVQLLGFNR